MHTPSNWLLALVTLFILSGCASIDSSRSPYQGPDNVGAAELSSLSGTWNVEVLNPRKSDSPMTSQITVNFDGTFLGFSAVDLSKKGADKVKYDISGVWSVDGDTINQTMNTVEQVAGTPFAAFGVAPGLGIVAGQTTTANVYEIGADQLVIVHQLFTPTGATEDVARRYTRVK